MIHSERAPCSPESRHPGSRRYGEPRTRSHACKGEVCDLGWLHASLLLLAQGREISFVCSLLGLCPDLLSCTECCWPPSLWSGKSSPALPQTQLQTQLRTWEVSSEEVRASPSQPDRRCASLQVYAVFAWRWVSCQRIPLLRRRLPSRSPFVSRLDFCHPSNSSLSLIFLCSAVGEIYPKCRAGLLLPLLKCHRWLRAT